MACTIHTFRCVHFACATGSTTCLEVLDNFAQHSAQAQDILRRELVERQIDYPVRCPMCQGPIDLEQSRQDAYKALSDIEELISAAGQQYDELGQKYHDLPFSCKAKTANSSKAALAHKQFAINAMSREDDPFFGLWHAIVELIFVAEELFRSKERRDPVDHLDLGTRLHVAEQSDEQSEEEPAGGSVEVADLKVVLGMINEIRQSIGAIIVTQMTALLEGIEEISAKSSKPRKPDYDDDDLPSRVRMAQTIAYKRWTNRLSD
ncbi:hypothetical protein LTR85_002434 [Meristemomyces frigidus]|nr:hypothetical protein LTR85_002434 [Meristemomyces frigidus]